MDTLLPYGKEHRKEEYGITDEDGCTPPLRACNYVYSELIDQLSVLTQSSGTNQWKTDTTVSLTVYNT